MLHLRLTRPALLVDISRLKALQQLEDAGRTWHIGAGVSHARLEDARGRLSGGEMLCEVAAAIAYRSVRNRGTIGGSLAHADPAADWPLTLAALGASVNVRGPTPRKILVAHFIQGAFTTTLAGNEIIESIDVPSCRAPDGMASTNSVVRRASLPKRARPPSLIPNPASRASFSVRCAEYRSRSRHWRSRWQERGRSPPQRKP